MNEIQSVPGAPNVEIKYEAGKIVYYVDCGDMDMEQANALIEDLALHYACNPPAAFTEVTVKAKKQDSAL